MHMYNVYITWFGGKEQTFHDLDFFQALPKFSSLIIVNQINDFSRVAHPHRPDHKVFIFYKK